MKSVIKKILPYLGAVFFFVDLYFSLCVFPANLVLNMFTPAMSQAQLDQMEYDYGQKAGYPAGEGIPVANNLAEYEELGDYKDAEGSEEYRKIEYFTFETDSIIPLDCYRLRCGVDLRVTSSRRQGAVTRQRKSFETSPYLTDRSYYNRCYLVALPDGNYVLAWLEDAYYWKYKLSGRVQLPLGCKDLMTQNEREFLEPYIQEYGLDEREILIMVCDELDEQRSGLYFLVQLGVLVGSLAVIIGVMVVVELIAKKVAKSRKVD